jgi:hypothetical protein
MVFKVFVELVALLRMGWSLDRGVGHGECIILTSMHSKIECYLVLQNLGVSIRHELGI